jgi:hypothetical protein
MNIMKLLQIYDYQYAVICSCCNAKVMDPDKKINQVHLKGKCPSCGKDSKEKKKNKKHKNRKNKRQDIADAVENNVTAQLLGLQVQ